MGCGDACPVLPAKRYLSGVPSMTDAVSQIRARIAGLVAELD